MAYVINESCSNCGACAGSCPTDAIIEGSVRYEIVADSCIDCGVCADICAFEAITAE